ncbi:DUF4383 domain-containing protein [Phycisphaerales bacterium AB-hyl4]|uniref:DUF4383 domain-containing protein n=1 Tax=Natronomicrosphaera hydrolytica TaxID=3242702 RepID=A0ABV4U8E4_9BACT
MQRAANDRPTERRHDAHRHDLNPATAARWTARVLGVVFILIALLGFFGDDHVLGIFSVNTLHNWVHLLSGVVLLGLGFASEVAARTTLWVFAVVYGLVMLLGFFGVQWINEALNMNMADHWLHLVLTAVFIIGAVVSHAQERSRHEATAATTRPRA